MFGYKLKLIKKDDEYEYDVFAKVVPSIREQINTFMAWIQEDFSLNESTVHQITVDVEGLKAMIGIYVHNKFASPSSGLMLVDSMNRLRQYAHQFISIIEEAQNLKIIENHASKAAENGAEYDEEEYQDCLSEAKQLIGEQIYVAVKGMLTQLRLMLINIEPDIISLAMGIDAMRERNKLYRKTSKGMEYVSGLGLKFVSAPKEEVLKNIKESKDDE